MYDFRMLQLRFMRWMTRRELARAKDEEGAAILEEIEEAMVVEVIEREVEDRIVAGGANQSRKAAIEAFTQAREEELPVIEGFYEPEGTEDEEPDLSEVDCMKCGETMQAEGLGPSVSIFPICPKCSEGEAGAADEDQE